LSATLTSTTLKILEALVKHGARSIMLTQRAIRWLTS
jgi:hypothetical protein